MIRQHGNTLLNPILVCNETANDLFAFKNYFSANQIKTVKHCISVILIV